VGGINWIWSINGKGFVLCICIYVDTMDDPEIPLRSIDEFRMEGIDPIVVGEYGDHCSCNLTSAKIDYLTDDTD
jgi:hypothetical protein